MWGHPLVVGLRYALEAALIVLAVVAPVFLIVNWLYDDGHGLGRLTLVVPVVWFGMAWLLARRRVSL